MGFRMFYKQKEVNKLMKKIFCEAKKILYNENNKPFVVLLFCSIIIHWFLPLNWADDAIFFRKSVNLDFCEFLKGSARPIIDSFTYFFALFPFLWRIINPIILTSFSLIVSKLVSCVHEKENNIFICCSILYPSMVVVDAGFIATTLNYLWAVTFGLFTLIPVKKYMIGNKVAPYEFLLTLPFLLYATNMQQMAVVLTVIFLGINVYLVLSKRFNVFILIQFAVALGGLAWSFCLNMFGENNRMLREAGRYFPTFTELNVIEKLELGFSSTFFSLTMNPHFAMLPFFSFAVFISVILIKKKRSPIICATSFLPPLFVAIMAVLRFVPESSFYEFITGGMRYYCMEKAAYSFEPVPDIVFLIVIAIVLLSLYQAFDNKKTFFISFIVLCFGLGSRLMMGLSPTVWASGHRTFFIMFLALIIVLIKIIDENFIVTKKEGDFERIQRIE